MDPPVRGVTVAHVVWLYLVAVALGLSGARRIWQALHRSMWRTLIHGAAHALVALDQRSRP